MAHDLYSLLPASVTLVFPRANAGQLTEGDVYAVAKTLVSLAIPEFAGITGYAGSKVVRATTPATFATSADVTPTNDAELQALAAQAATDWYRYQASKPDVKYVGCVDWQHEGLSDHIEWTYRLDEVSTRVQRPVFNHLEEELCCRGAAGTVAPPPPVNEIEFVETTSYTPTADGHLFPGKLKLNNPQAGTWTDAPGGTVWLERLEFQLYPFPDPNVRYGAIHKGYRVADGIPIYKQVSIFGFVAVKNLFGGGSTIGTSIINFLEGGGVGITVAANGAIPNQMVDVTLTSITTSGSGPPGGTPTLGLTFIDILNGIFYFATGTAWVAVGPGVSTNHNLLSATHPDTLTGTVVKGDVIVGNATPKWARLAGVAGTTRNYLKSDATAGVANVPAWALTYDTIQDGGTARAQRNILNAHEEQLDAVDDSGGARTNLLVRHSGAWIFRSSNQVNIANVTWTTIDWTGTNYDTDSYADLTNNRFLFPSPGTYMVGVVVAFAANSNGERQVKLRHDQAGTIVDVATISQNAVGGGIRTFMVLWHVLNIVTATNNRVDAQVWQSSGGNLDLEFVTDNAPRMLIYRIGK